MAKGKKLPKLLDIPSVPIVDLRIRAICQVEQVKRKKIPLHTVSIKQLNHWCINHLRHHWVTEYENYLRKKPQVHPATYVAIHEQITELIIAKYPMLKNEALEQLEVRKKRVLGGLNFQDAVEAVKAELFKAG